MRGQNNKRLIVEDYIGKKLYHVIVMEKVDKTTNKSPTLVVGKCNCGVVKNFVLSSLISGHTTNCGCVRRAKTIARNTSHGMSYTSLYRTWRGMKTRCYNKSDKRYSDWGGRGITVCDDWLNNFEAFCQWAIVNGYEQGLQLDRKKNNEGYSPSNCRFVTSAINNLNKRSSRILSFEGKSMTMVEWTRLLGFGKTTLDHRINKAKWSIEKALSTPLLGCDRRPKNITTV